MINVNSVVQTDQIGENVAIFEFCVIRPNVKIGNNVIIHPHVIIYEGTEISDNVEIFSGTVIGKEPKSPDILARSLDFVKKVRVGANTSIGPNVIIYYDVVIGNNCLIGDAVAIREKCIIGNRCILGRHVSLNYNVIVGDDSTIMAKSHMTGNTNIGKSVFIGVGVNTANDNYFGARGYDADLIKGPTIGNNAKIGVGAILLPNIQIGENALIAAGSVVTKNVDRNSHVMGVPAKHIRYIDLT